MGGMERQTPLRDTLHLWISSAAAAAVALDREIY